MHPDNKITKKFCTECGLFLDISNFKKVTTQSALKKTSDGYYWCCTDCYKKKAWIYQKGEEPNNRQAKRRDKKARRVEDIVGKYDLSEAEYMEKIAEQKNLCAICGKKDERRVLCVDHDHKTGKVRGLLCNNCNIGLGNLRDDPQILQSAIGYLKKYT